jgi:thymidine phosphorylase
MRNAAEEVVVAATVDIRRYIELKRDGARLEDEDWAAIIPAIAGGRVPEAQIGSWLMAVFVRGLTTRERASYTREMIASGQSLRWDHLGRPVVDKHSTGGVGDKVSLIWAPLVAAAGAAVPMISGRGLGHTGGTLDKLEAIDGYEVALDPERMGRILSDVGCVICGQTETMVPADRVLYDLRNRTATVGTVDHIAPSIMSKKLSEGLDRLVLDVKFGNGAFMKGVDDARHLAQVMADLGAAVGCRTTALLTSMEAPLGRFVGHAAEVHESLELLEGRGPADTRELVLALAAEVVDDVDLAALLDGGEPRERFARMVAAQGGDLDAFRWPGDAQAVGVSSPADGVVEAVSALGVGLAVADLGGARTGADESPDPAVAVEVLVRPGQTVSAGEEWARIWHREGRGLERAEQRLRESFRVGAGVEGTAQILQRVEATP